MLTQLRPAANQRKRHNKVQFSSGPNGSMVTFNAVALSFDATGEIEDHSVDADLEDPVDKEDTASVVSFVMGEDVDAIVDIDAVDLIPAEGICLGGEDKPDSAVGGESICSDTAVDIDGAVAASSSQSASVSQSISDTVLPTFTVTIILGNSGLPIEGVTLFFPDDSDPMCAQNASTSPDWKTPCEQKVCRFLGDAKWSTQCSRHMYGGGFDAFMPPPPVSFTHSFTPPWV